MASFFFEIPWRFRMRVRKKPKKDFYEPEVHEEMIAAARRLDDTTAEVAVLATGELGLRRGEAYALLYRHCRIRERKVIVEEAELIIKKERVLSDPKGRKTRTVDMSERVAEALERHAVRTGRRTGRVFLRSDGSPFTDHTWRDMMIRVEKEAGVEDAKGKTHIFRHTYCSHLAMLNVPTIAIKELAGHESLATTEGYMHLSPNARSTALDRLNNRQSLLLGGSSDGANIGATPSTEAATTRIYCGVAGNRKRVGTRGGHDFAEKMHDSTRAGGGFGVESCI